MARVAREYQLSPKRLENGEIATGELTSVELGCRSVSALSPIQHLLSSGGRRAAH